MKLLIMKSLRYYLAFLPIFILLIFQNGYAQTAQQEAEEMLGLVNVLRADNGIAPVALNAELNMAAFDHSDDMARNNYFSHTGLNGSTFSQRAIAAGYTGSPRGENIAAGNSSVVNTFNQWVNSSGHLNNMLNSGVDEMGIGHATYNGSTYTHYWTQIFGKGSGILTVEDHVIAEKIITYPNPVQDMLHIRFENAIQERLDLKLMSTTGQIVYQQLVNTLDADLIINIGHLPSGIYFLYVQNTLLQKTIKY
jgi:hypothetical protein